MARTPVVWINAELCLAQSEHMTAEQWGKKFHEVMETIAAGDPLIPVPEWLRFDDPYQQDDDASR